MKSEEWVDVCIKERKGERERGGVSNEGITSNNETIQEEESYITKERNLID